MGHRGAIIAAGFPRETEPDFPRDNFLIGTVMYFTKHNLKTKKNKKKKKKKKKRRKRYYSCIQTTAL